MISYPSTNAASVSYDQDTDVFNVGTLKAGDTVTNSVTLPITVAANAGGNKQCLTATLTGNPPPGAGPYSDDISDNVAKLCLGAAPPAEQVALRDGTVDLFTWYDCVGKTAAPCNENDSLELVALTNTAAPEFGTVHQPSQAVVHIPDPEGRTVDKNGALLWSTGVAYFTGLPGDKDRPGVIIAVNSSLLNYMSTTNDPGNWGVDHPTWTNWHTGHIKVTAVVPIDDQGNPLGEIKGWRKQATPDELFWGNDVDPNDATDPTLLMDYNLYLGDSTQAVGGWRDERYIEFSALGTYLLTVTTTVEYDDDGDSNTNTASYSDTETYTFHIGPMSNLEVRDGGISNVAPGRTAYTILATNNGPENTVDATVKVALPPGAQVEDYVASDGTYANGAWTLPGLKLRDYRHSQGIPEEASLTLILKDGGIPQEPATATISLTDNAYTVCIGSDRGTLAHDNHPDCKSDSKTTNTWHTAVCVNTADNEIDSTITVEATCNSTTDRAWTANVCAASGGKVITGRTETQCDGWFQGTVYEYPNNNNVVKISARRGTQVALALRTSPATAGVSLSWPARAGADGYAIRVSEDDGATWKPLAFRVNGTSYTHQGIPIGETRNYEIYPLYGDRWPVVPLGTTSYTAGQTARSQQASPPGAPEQMTLVATPLSRAEISLSWVPPEDYGSDITRYTLQVSDRSGGPWRNVDPQPGLFDVGYDYGGLPPNTLKYFRIRAANEFGGGAWSAVANARTVAAGLPGPPRNVWANPSGENAISLWWDAPEADGDSPVTRYEAQWSADGSESGSWGSVGTTENRGLDHTGLAIGATRHYRVRARNAQGWGPWSLPPYSSATTLGGEPLENYPSLWAEPSGQSAIEIAWTPPFDRDGRAITRYELQWFEDQGVDCYQPSSAGKYSTLRRPSASERSYTHTGLKPDHTYCYRLRAGTSAVWSDWTHAEATTERAGTPAAPSLTVRANGAEEIKVSWTKPNDGGSRITHYDLEWTANLAEHIWSWVDRDGLPAGTTSYTDAGLASGTERHYRLRAHNENGPGQWSAVRGATTVSGGPDAPTGLAATAHATNQQIDLSWTAPDDTGDSSITGYWVERSRSADGPWERLTSGNRTTTYRDTRNLYPGMVRHYRVAAVNRSGAGMWSEVATSTATAGTPATAPDPPGLLRFTGVGPDWVSFTWDRPDDGGAPITGYEYHETLSEEIFTTTGTSATIRGLDNGLAFYSFRVRALNAVGEGEWSGDIHANLWPQRSEQVRVSPTTITVNEGGTARFTVSLNRAPPLPVRVGVYPRGDRADDLLYDAYRYSDKVLIPSGWSHPEGYDWSDRVHNWSRGVPVSVEIDENPVTEDEAGVVDVEIGLMSHYELGISADEWNAKWGVTPDGPTEWDQSIFRGFKGPSVKITVRNSNSN